MARFSVRGYCVALVCFLLNLFVPCDNARKQLKLLGLRAVKLSRRFGLIRFGAYCTAYEKKSFEETALFFTVAILAMIFVIGAIGNICACLVIIQTKSLHTRANYILLCLACSDMLLLFLGCPLDVYHLINCYTSNNFLCKSWFFIREASSFTSIIIICVFTAERWLSVRNPLQKEVKSRNFCCAFAVAGCSASLIATFMRMNAATAEVKIGNETLNICHGRPSELMKYIEIITFTLSYLIPVVMLATMYFHIAVLVRPAPTIQTECSRKAPIKMTRLLVALVVSFLICWSPHQFVQLYTIFGGKIKMSMAEVIYKTTVCCYYLNCAVNPILYNTFSKKFRRALLHMIRGVRPTATARVTCSTSVGSKENFDNQH